MNRAQCVVVSFDIVQPRSVTDRDWILLLIYSLQAIKQLFVCKKLKEICLFMNAPVSLKNKLSREKDKNFLNQLILLAF